MVDIADSSKFDADDTISDAQPELKKVVQGYNTIAEDYNAGLLTGLDSAGQINLSDYLKKDAISGDYECSGDIDLNGNSITSDVGNPKCGDDLQFPGGFGPACLTGELRVRGDTTIKLDSATGEVEVASPVIRVLSPTGDGQLIVESMTNPATKITSPERGAIVYNTTTNKFQGYTGTAWVDLS